jgi:hypothetical protein
MTETDVEAEPIYARVVANVRGLVQILETWPIGRINTISTRRIQINIALSTVTVASAELVLYERSGVY